MFKTPYKVLARPLPTHKCQLYTAALNST